MRAPRIDCGAARIDIKGGRSLWQNRNVTIGGLSSQVRSSCSSRFPGLTLATITAILGAGFLVSGILDLVGYVRLKGNLFTSPSPWMIVYAVLDIIIGIMLLLHPIVFAGVVSWLVGIFVVAFGVIEVVGAVQLRKFSMPMWGWMVFSGIVDILCGVVFFVYPAMLAVFLAVFVIMRGVSLIMYGWRADSVLM